MTGKKGQSLIEVLVGAVMISVALVALTNAVVKALQAATYARNKSEATKLATKAVESIRAQRDSMSWEEFDSAYGGSVHFDSSGGFEVTASFAQESCGGADPADSKKVTTIVTWDGGRKEVRTITCFTKWDRSSAP